MLWQNKWFRAGIDEAKRIGGLGDNELKRRSKAELAEWLVEQS